MKELIKQTARDVKISEIGFLRAGVFDDLGAVLDGQPAVPMTEPDIEKRINPFLIMDDAKTIIACLCSYYCGDKEGNISKYARGIDYHTVMRDKLSKLCEVLLKCGYKAEMFCDNGALNDRYIAVRAGLGFIGRNGFLINERFGTYTFIGYIITDCGIEPDNYKKRGCMNCGRCAAACPTGAIGENGIDGYRCLSYITQKKGQLTEEEERFIYDSGCAWGCDVCQDVCPHNDNIEFTSINEFRENLIDELEIDSGISNREFKRTYANRAFSWRGKAPLLRNLEILSGDMLSLDKNTIKKK